MKKTVLSELRALLARILAVAALFSGLSASASTLIDDFDPSYDPAVWAGFEGTPEATTISAFYGTGSTGKSLRLNGSAQRSATTVPVDTSQPGEISFLFVYTPTNFEAPDPPGKEVFLEYSVDGTNFVRMGGPYAYHHLRWTRVIEPIPPGAQTAQTQFRLIQTNHDGTHQDTWSIDDLAICPTTTAPEIFSSLTAESVTGRTFEYEFRASGRVDILSATNLPDGLSFDPATGLITGSVLTAGTYQITLSATNLIGTTTETLALNVSNTGLQVALFAGGFISDRPPLEIRAMLERLGYVVTLFWGWEPENWHTAFASSDLVVYASSRVPENNPGAPDFESAINSRLASGHPLLLIGGGGEFLRRLWGINDTTVLNPIGTTNGPLAKRAGVAGFPNSPANLRHDLRLHQILRSELPGNATEIYENLHWAPFDLYYAPVFTVGKLGYVGYYWQDGAAADWETVLQDMVSHLRPSPRSRPLINSPLTARAAAGTPFRYDLRVAGGPITYGANGLPAGLSINPANGILSGIPLAAGNYSIPISATNTLGTTNRTLNLTVLAPPAGEGLRIVDLDPTSLATIDPSPFIDTTDREVMAVSSERVFLSSAVGTAGFNLLDLGDGAATDLRLRALCYDLATGATYLAAYNGTPLARHRWPWDGDRELNQLIEIHPATGALLGSKIQLPITIPLYPGTCGVFNGNGRIVIHNGLELFDISLRDGSVTRLGDMARPNWDWVEGWAEHGVVESFAGNLYLVYRAKGSSIIERCRIPDCQIESIALTSPANVWALSPAINRWYYTPSSPLSGERNKLHAAAATIELGAPATPPAITSAPMAEILSEREFRFRITASPSPETFGAIGLPPGLVLDPDTGLITGVVATGGAYPITLSATNALGTTNLAFTLNVLSSPTTLHDDFDPDPDASLWSDPIEVSTIPGERAGPQSRGNSLYFHGRPFRAATTRSLDLRAGGEVFFIYAAGTSVSSSTGWTGPGSDDDLVLEYSLDGETFTQFGGPYPHQPQWTSVRAPVPAAAQASSVQIRLRSTNFGFQNHSSWGIDDFLVGDPTVLPAITSPVRGQYPTGVPIEFQITAVPAVTHFEASGLPPGLQIDSDSGLITGTPSAAGSYLAQFTASNAAGSTTNQFIFSVPDQAASIAIYDPFGPRNTEILTAAFEELGFNTFTTSSLFEEQVPADILVYPSSSRTVTVTDEVNSVLQEALAQGKILIVTGTSTGADTNFLNELAGWSLVDANRLPFRAFFSISPGALAFQNAPPEISGSNTETVTTQSLPASAKPIYEFELSTGVFTDGQIGYLGYRWHRSAPDWDDVLGDMVPAITGPATLRPAIQGTFLLDTYTGKLITVPVRTRRPTTSVTIDGLPAGLTFDAQSNTITGRITTAGIYTVTINATNALGTTTAPFVIVVEETFPFLEDDFDPDTDASLWAVLPPTTRARANTTGERAGPGSIGNSLWFGGSGDRLLATIPIDTRSSNELSFLIATGNGRNSPWESVGGNYPVYFEYTTDGTNWVQLGERHFNTRWETVVLPLPPEARTQATEFRFRQNQFSTTANNWAIDEVRLGPPAYPPQITSSLAEHRYSGTEVRYQITATGFPVVGATGLPAGLSFEQATGRIVGTVESAGVYAITLSANNAFGSDSQMLELTIEDALPSFFDDFDPDSALDPALWDSFGPGLAANTTGQIAGPESAGNSLYFGGVDRVDRYAVTKPIDTRLPGRVNFLLASGDADNPWEIPDPGDEIVLEYSIDDGETFEIMGGPYPQETGWRQMSEPIPIEYAATQFRLRQLWSSGPVSDHWAIDDLSIGPQAPPPGNGPPRLENMTVRIHTGFSRSIPFEEILQQVTDPDGHNAAIRSLDATSAQGFALSRSDGKISYDVPASFVGSDSFNITLTDGFVVEPATVQIEVREVPAVQLLNGPEVTVGADGSITVCALGEPGWTYGIIRSTTLLSWNWTHVGTATADANGKIVVTDPEPPEPAAFYQLVFPSSVP